MKKNILLGMIILVFLVGCGEKYKTYSPEEKYNRIVKLQEIEKKSVDTLTKEEEDFKKEMRDLLTTLKTESQKDTKAKKEFDEWKDAVVKYQKEEVEKAKKEAREEAKKTKMTISF
jgi:hypothetical protein